MGSKPIGISASRGASILGISKYNTPLDTWLKIKEEMEPGFCESRGYAAPVREYSRIFEMGHRFEEPVITEAEKLISKISMREAFYECPGSPFLTCHIDGMHVDKKCLHEGKTTNIYTFYDSWGEPGTEEIPEDIFIQVQHQMMCTGVKECIVSVMVFPIRQDDFLEVPTKEEAFNFASVYTKMGMFHQYPIKRDDDIIDEMKKSYTHFWTKNVLQGIAPEDKTYSDIRKMLIPPVGTMIASEEVEEWIYEYAGIGTEEKQIKNRRDELKTLIIKAAKICPELHIDGDSMNKIIIKDKQGFKIGSYAKSGFRASKRRD